MTSLCYRVLVPRSDDPEALAAVALFLPHTDIGRFPSAAPVLGAAAGR